MKKICTILIVLMGVLLFDYPKTSANENFDISNTLVIEEQTDISNNLDYPGYQIVTNNVNTNVPGEYQVIYESIETGTRINKKVVVLNEDEKYYIEQKNIEVKENKLYKFNVFSTTQVGDNDYIITTKATPNSSTVNSDILYLFYVKDDTLYKSYFVVYLQNQDLVDVVYNPVKDEIISVVTGANNMDGNLDFEFYVRKSNNLIVGTYKQNRIEKDTATSILLVKNNLIISGYTIDNKTLERDSFVAFYDTNTYELNNLFTYSVKGDDMIIDIFSKDNYIYAVREKDSKYSILKIDIFGNLHDEVNINYNYSANYIKKIDVNNEVYFLMNVYNYDYLDYEQVIYKLDEKMNIVEISKYYSPNAEVKDVYLKGEKIVYLLCDELNQTSYYQQKDLRDSSILINKNLEKQADQMLFSSSNIPHIVTVNEENKLIIDSFNYIYLNEKLPKTINYNDLNESQLEGDYKNYSLDIVVNEDINLDVFGSYKGYYFYNGIIDYLCEVEVEVPYFSGVEEGKIYDVGVKLYPNGTASLNGVYIEKGHVINEAGEYELMVKGVDETKIISFTVSNISCSNFNNIVGNNRLPTFPELRENEAINEKKDNQLTYKVSLSEEEIKRKTIDNTAWFYVMPIVAAAISLSFILRKD